MIPKKWKQNQVQPFNDHFFLQCMTNSHPPSPLLLLLGWNSSRITACVLFIPILFLLQHLAVAPPLSPLCPLPALPSSPSLICPDIDGSWMLANDCLWRPFMHPLLTLPVIPHRLDLLANRSPRLWISLSVLQLAQSFNLFIYIILFLLIPMSAPNL